MNSISIGWKRQAEDRVNFGTKNEHADHRSVRKVVPKKQQKTVKTVETTRRGPILPIKRFSNSRSYATLSANTSATDVSVYRHRRLCSVRAAVMTFIIVVIIILLTAICLGIVFGVLKSQNSSGDDSSSSNLNSLSTPSAVSYTSSISVGNQIGLPCSGYTEINDPTRSSSYTANILSCDNGPLFNTTNGGSWIRFVGSGGTTLALSPPDINRCGAYLPIWYNNTLSIPPNTVINDIACVLGYTDTCLAAIAISVVLCSSGNYYVFFLPPTSFCSSRYCTQ
ncbi:unnamed protein product [Adineta ricciae]|uniref:Uncharacterized protein n=1 Tax=Adineta ricciae TaxID=249248 RepID=A0A813XHY4_ADIRI|nr:unnamed protein product [Adineta ricciae]CAF1645774.1 unnamed protein product [Adineta ricciae]